MSNAKSGDTVRIHYTGKLDDGTEFDSSSGRDPIEFKLGDGQVITGFEKAVQGMSVGDTKQFTVPPAEGYGERTDELIQDVPRSALPDDIKPAVGMALQSTDPDGGVTRLTVTAVSDESITVDAARVLVAVMLARSATWVTSAQVPSVHEGT